MAKTIENFRAEYGVRLDTLSEVTGIETQVLASSERLLPVPSQIAQIIIEKYNLPPYYFTGASSSVSAEEKIPNTLDKFVVPSIVWNFATSFIATLPASISMTIITITSVMSRAANINISTAFTEGLNKAISLLGIFWTVAVIIISCNIFAKWLENKRGFSADKQKFKYLYWIIPSGMTGTVSYILNNIFYNETVMSAKMALSLLCSFVGMACVIVLLAFMLKAISVNHEKDKKMLNFFYIFCGANVVLHTVLSLLFQVIHGTLSPMFIFTVIKACVMAVMAAGLLNSEKKNSNEKVYFIYLPIAYIIIPNVIDLITKLFNF